jgi:hypothetical protein
MSVWDGSQWRSIQKDGANPATVDEWPEWMTNGNKVRIEIAIKSTLQPHQIAHTLNHEISLHAMSFLTLIRKVRDMSNKKMAENFVEATLLTKMGKFSDEYAHAQLGANKNPRLKATHAAMVEELGEDNKSVDLLTEDYESDVKAHKKFVPVPYVPPHLRGQAVVNHE